MRRVNNAYLSTLLWIHGNQGKQRRDATSLRRGKLIALWLLPFSFYAALKGPYIERIYQNVCNRRQVGLRRTLYFGHKRRIGAAVKFL